MAYATERLAIGQQMTGYCYRCAAGVRPEEWCAGCPNRPKPLGKTWAEEAIERWEAMEPGDEATRLLQEIMREHWKDLTRREPRRLFKGTVVLRRLERHEKLKSRMRRIEMWRYYCDLSVARPLGAQEAHRG